MPSIISELKRRNVFRVAVAYSVATWLLLQIADLSLGIVDAPPWIIQSLFIVLAVGFVFAVIFSWLYELTPEGLVRESDIDNEQSITVYTAKKLDYLTIVLVLAAVGYLIVDRYVLEPVTPATPPQTAEQSVVEPTTPELQANSIAVLPFSDLSQQGDQGYFSDGISEELLNLLAGVDGLKVASRTSSFAYKGQSLNIPEIAKELKVANILEGSVRKAGNTVRITAQLIDARDDRHLWSETFDRDLVDIFAIQDEIATAIVNALIEQLGVQVSSDHIVVTNKTDNLDAYDLYLQARTFFVARQNLDTAIELFQRAIELDPDYAKAWEGLAAVQRVADDWLLDDDVDHFPLAVEAARKAIELNPELSMPYAVLAHLPFNVSAETGRPDIAESLRLMDLAIEKDPNNTSAWLWRGLIYAGLGYFDDALADLDECIKRDPAYLNCHSHRAAVLLNMGETDAAMADFESLVYENFHSMSDLFVSELVDRGQPMAAALLATVKINRPYAPVGEWIEALRYPQTDHRARQARFDSWAREIGYHYAEDIPNIPLAFKNYEKAMKSAQMRFVLHSPSTKAFRQTPYFKQWVFEHGYLDHWQKYGFPSYCQVFDDQDFSCD